MKLHFFAIPAAGSVGAESALNALLGTQRVSQIDRQFVADGAASFWAICVTTIEGGETSVGERPPKGRGVDYREVLSSEEFAIYDRLRTLRKQTAEAEGLPTYAVFTNEQLAEMVRRRVDGVTALVGIDGVGDARVRRYGDAFLAVLRDLLPRLPVAGAAG